MKILLALLLLAGTALAADETVTYRVLGLFSRDREADLRATMQDVPGISIVSVDFERGEATFTYDPEVVFKGAKREEILNRFDTAIRSASNRTFGIAPVCTTPKEQLTRVEIAVAGLDCKACCLAAYEAVAKIDGVAQATASFKDRLVTALIDPAKTNRAALEAALKKKQIPVGAP